MEVPVAVTALVAMTGLEVLMGVTMVTVKVTVLASLAATGALGIWLRWWWIMRGRWKMDWGWMWSSASGDGGGCGSVGSSKCSGVGSCRDRGSGGGSSIGGVDIGLEEAIRNAFEIPSLRLRS